MHGRARHLVELLALVRVGGVAADQVGQPDDRVHGRADLVAHVGQEGALGLVGFVGHGLGAAQLGIGVLQLQRLLCQSLAGLFEIERALGHQLFQLVAVAGQFPLGLLAAGDVHPDASHALAVVHLQGAHRHPEVAHVARLVAPLGLEVLAALGLDALELFIDLASVRVQLQVVQAHLRKFLARVAQRFVGGIIEAHELQGLHVQHHDADGSLADDVRVQLLPVMKLGERQAAFILGLLERQYSRRHVANHGARSVGKGFDLRKGLVVPQTALAFCEPLQNVIELIQLPRCGACQQEP